MRPWTKRLLATLAVLLVLTLSLPLVDRAWFGNHVPSGFVDAPWQGDWSSDAYPLVSGRLLVRLPDPIPINEDFTVDAIAYYHIWSPYRTGEMIPMTMAGRYEPANFDTNEEEPGSFSFNFEGIGGRSSQTIDYIASGSPDDLIFGEYHSQNPHDVGRFELTRR